MSRFHAWQSGTAVLSAFAVIAGAAAPIVMQAPAQAQVAFSDVSSDYWARPFIRELANRGILSGFPDGTFRPNDPVTRAQFAAMVRQAFRRSPVREAASFMDVPSDYWASAAIRDAYTTGFLSGYPGNIFRPDEFIPRAQVLVSLSNGLGYNAANAVDNTLRTYNDAGSIPDWAKNSIAAATEKKIVVNYPDVRALNPNRSATRAEVAAFIYQALVSSGQVSAIQSPYVVGQTGTTTPPVTGGVQIPTGTTIPVRYSEADKIYISPEEPEPVPLTLTVGRDIVAQNGRVLIPAGSLVSGELRAVQGGAQFFSREVILTNGTRLPISASSSVVTNTETVRRGANLLELLAGAALGAGAAAGIAAVTGDEAIATEEVLGGGAAGALAGLFLGRNRVTLLSISPNTDLDLRLTSPLAVQ
ncbi:S-layer homology domain-containing protein [Leptolyngbya sp. FACHB-711]|uniref:S-layer homology domain-containing protein n=1 Tax=unclassified Leptolyngbya TaxID=2650499 RepID=UPI00168996C2|nr:S-layer homology domain-containing protein [Leptolyngbya sp. FACHB-711]MBD1850264.1 S-layer homology domain-containing protein [Cyanobacteria bacterium FACHB-502]MBD2025614.1 S-layer homology domain-containing protein [Leptolyngbya sp. FACHB-711]